MRIIFLLVTLGFFLSPLTAMGQARLYAAEDKHQHAKGDYYCPMHPDYTSDRKGACPICGMDLVKREAPAPAPVKAGKETEKAGVVIDPAKQQMIGVTRAAVFKQHLSQDIRTVGKVAYDPELYVAQAEYAQALTTAAQMDKSPVESIRQQSTDLLSAAERKLILLGMSQAEIAQLKTAGVPQDNLYLPGQSGKALVYVTVYEYELGLVKQGQKVELQALAYPGEIFSGVIVSIAPVINPMSRSAKVRVEAEDPAGKLKPEMYVNARISIDLGEKLAVPFSAVMDSGLRKIVYVVEDNKFIARDVVLGSQAGDYYEVISGLSEGETVVTSGNFLIDAESRLKGAL